MVIDRILSTARRPATSVPFGPSQAEPFLGSLCHPRGLGRRIGNVIISGYFRQEGKIADFALFAPDDCFHSSLGACLDSFALVRDQVGRLFERDLAIPMESRLRLVTLGGEPARLADGRSIAADSGIDSPVEFDLVHIASFRVGGLRALDDRLAETRSLYPWLRRQHDRGAIISGSGSAVFLLAEAGLLGNLPVPLPRILIPLYRQRFPRQPIDERRPLIEHGRIVIGSGLAADQALMVRVIERTISAEMGRWVGSVIGLDSVTVDTLVEDPLVANAQLWLESRFAHDVRIADLAVSLSVSHQTLTRHFIRGLGMPPKAYVQKLRVDAAKRMLARTHRSVDQIAALVGYRDTRSFRAIFRHRTGMTASAYRELARIAPPAR